MITTVIIKKITGKKLITSQDALTVFAKSDIPIAVILKFVNYLKLSDQGNELNNEIFIIDSYVHGDRLKDNIKFLTSEMEQLTEKHKLNRKVAGKLLKLKELITSTKQTIFTNLIDGIHIELNVGKTPQLIYTEKIEYIKYLGINSKELEETKEDCIKILENKIQVYYSNKDTTTAQIVESYNEIQEFDDSLKTKISEILDEKLNNYIATLLTEANDSQSQDRIREILNELSQIKKSQSQYRIREILNKSSQISSFNKSDSLEQEDKKIALRLKCEEMDAVQWYYTFLKNDIERMKYLYQLKLKYQNKNHITTEFQNLMVIAKNYFNDSVEEIKNVIKYALESKDFNSMQSVLNDLNNAWVVPVFKGEIPEELTKIYDQLINAMKTNFPYKIRVIEKRAGADLSEMESIKSGSPGLNFHLNAEIEIIEVLGGGIYVNCKGSNDKWQKYPLNELPSTALKLQINIAYGLQGYKKQNNPSEYVQNYINNNLYLIQSQMNLAVKTRKTKPDTPLINTLKSEAKNSVPQNFSGIAELRAFRNFIDILQSNPYSFPDPKKGTPVKWEGITITHIGKGTSGVVYSLKDQAGNELVLKQFLKKEGISISDLAAYESGNMLAANKKLNYMNNELILTNKENVAFILMNKLDNTESQPENKKAAVTSWIKAALQVRSMNKLGIILNNSEHIAEN